MLKPHEKLARSLKVLLERRGEGRRIFRSAEFPREDRERLLRNGHLLPVIRGWLMLSSPAAIGHDTTPWYASFWEFCARYSTHRFGERWHLSPELSLLLHAENTTVPRQVIVHAERGGNNLIALPFETSLFDLKVQTMPPPEDTCEREGVRLYTTEAALVRVRESFYRDHPLDAHTVLAGVAGVGAVASRLLGGGHSKVAGRLAGAFRHVGRQDIADGVRQVMLNAGHRYRETNPFGVRSTATSSATAGRRPTSPLTSRLESLWEHARGSILAVLPRAPGRPIDDYPWTTIQVGDRKPYMSALDTASLDGDVTPFAELIAGYLEHSLRPGDSD